MIKTFSLGVILGVAAAFALLFFVPAVDQGRERSIISVQPGGGNREVFHVNLPGDRILAGGGNSELAFPAAIDWPDFEGLADSQTELFKIRNDDERVIGVASRIAAGQRQPFVEWAVHMPARGTIYVVLDGNTTAAGNRVGVLNAGTREFSELRGNVIERYVADVGTTEDGDSVGRLELITALVGPEAPLTLIAEREQ